MNSTTDRESDLLSTRIAAKFAPPQLLAIDDWRLIRHLGSGSTAHVWLLHNELRSQYVACKTPKTHLDAAALSQEAQLAGGLFHENLVARSELSPSLSLAETTFWEFLAGGSLSNLVASTGVLSLANTVTVLWPMLQVAQYLHSQQIVHGDISPRNILFDLTGRPVLIDLGAARATAHSSTLTGTPGFVAPELVHPTGQIEGLGAAADVYSLGAIGWFCLTGMMPGPTHARVPLVTLNPDLGADTIELLEASLSEQPALRPSLSQLMGAVPHWAKPEPVDLFPAVGEEYELLLPTRKPLAAQTPKRRTRKQSRQSPAKLRSKGKAVRCPSASRRRIVLGLSTLALAGGVAVTATYGNPGAEQLAVGSQADEQTKTTQEVDFQAIIDSLAKARSTAWKEADPSLSDTYAVADSKILTEDRAVLESLDSAGHTLDGIRMRAVVRAVEHIDEHALVTVEWRTGRYAQRDASGEMVEEFQPQTETIDMTLQETAEGWKLADVAVRS